MRLLAVCEQQQKLNLSCLFSVVTVMASLISLSAVSTQVYAQAALEELDWAYAISPAFPGEVDDGPLYSLPVS